MRRQDETLTLPFNIILAERPGSRVKVRFCRGLLHSAIVHDRCARCITSRSVGVPLRHCASLRERSNGQKQDRLGNHVENERVNRVGDANLQLEKM